MNLFVIIILISSTLAIHHFNCYAPSTKYNICYSNYLITLPQIFSLEVYPEKKYDKLDCILITCDKKIPFNQIIKYNWTCIGEPRISCKISPIESNMNCFIYSLQVF